MKSYPSYPLNVFPPGLNVISAEAFSPAAAGPVSHDMPGRLNLYRVHYDGIHVVGTAGSIPQDMVDVIKLIEDEKIHANSGCSIAALDVDKNDEE